MEFFDPAQKKARAVRLFIGYILVAVAIALGLFILVLQSYGYDVDRRTGKIIQNGIIFVSAHPVGADVYVNGQQKDSTNARLTIPSGNYKIELKKSGYRTWQHDLNLEGGTIEQLDYPWLFPEKLITSDQQLYEAKPMMASETPDGHWLLIPKPGSLTAFNQFDITNKNTTQTTVSLPASLMTKASGNHKLAAVEWSSDNRHLLLKHSYRGGNEFIMLDRTRPASSVNLNKLFKTNPSSVALQNKKSDKLYFYDDKKQTLSLADSSTNRFTKVLNSVVTFKTFKTNNILYLSSADKTHKTYQLSFWDGHKNYSLHSYPAKSGYLVDIADYGQHNYVVLSSHSAGVVYLYRDALGQAKSGRSVQPFLSLRIANPQFLSYSHNARFIAVQSGSHFAVYDIENSRRFYYQLKQDLAAGQKAAWMDGHRLTISADNQGLVFDFDGTNRQVLSASLPGYDLFFDSSFSALYQIAPSVETPKLFSLTRTELRVP